MLGFLAALLRILPGPGLFGTQTTRGWSAYPAGEAHGPVRRRFREQTSHTGRGARPAVHSHNCTEFAHPRGLHRLVESTGRWEGPLGRGLRYRRLRQGWPSHALERAHMRGPACYLLEG